MWLRKPYDPSEKETALRPSTLEEYQDVSGVSIAQRSSATDTLYICPSCFVEDDDYFAECKRNMAVLWQSEHSYPLVKPCEKHVKSTEVEETIAWNFAHLGALAQDVDGMR